MLETIFDILYRVVRLPISQLISVLAGGAITFYATHYSIRRNQSIEDKRLRRALITEIESIQIEEIHDITSVFLDDEGDKSEFDKLFEDELEDMMYERSDEFIDIFEDSIDSKRADDDEIREALEEEFEEKLSGPLFDAIIEETNSEDIRRAVLRDIGQSLYIPILATPIWDSNTDKIGNLKMNEIDKVMNFYQSVSSLRNRTQITVDAATRELKRDNQDVSESLLGDSFEENIKNLRLQARHALDRKEAALEALDSDNLQIKEEL